MAKETKEQASMPVGAAPETPETVQPVAVAQNPELKALLEMTTENARQLVLVLKEAGDIRLKLDEMLQAVSEIKNPKRTLGEAKEYQPIKQKPKKQ